MNNLLFTKLEIIEIFFKTFTAVNCIWCGSSFLCLSWWRWILSIKAFEGFCWPCSAGSLLVTVVVTEEGSCSWFLGGTGYHSSVGRDMGCGLVGNTGERQGARHPIGYWKPHPSFICSARARRATWADVGFSNSFWLLLCGEGAG